MILQNPKPKTHIQQLDVGFVICKKKFLTTHHERDVETGLDYRGARFYDSDVGRFFSLDPLAADFANMSPYNYVLGNPIALIDPDGKAPEPPPLNLMIVFDKNQEIAFNRSTNNQNWTLLHVNHLSEAADYLNSSGSTINNLVIRGHGNQKGFAINPNAPFEGESSGNQITVEALIDYMVNFMDEGGKPSGANRQGLVHTYGESRTNVMDAMVNIFSQLEGNANVCFSNCSTGAGALPKNLAYFINKTTGNESFSLFLNNDLSAGRQQQWNSEKKAYEYIILDYPFGTKHYYSKGWGVTTMKNGKPSTNSVGENKSPQANSTGAPFTIEDISKN